MRRWKVALALTFSSSCVVLGLLAAHDLTRVLNDGRETPLGQLAHVALLARWLLPKASSRVNHRVGCGVRSVAQSAALVLSSPIAVRVTSDCGIDTMLGDAASVSPT